MKLIKLKPITNGTRHQVRLAKNLLAKDNTLGKKSIYTLHDCKGRSPATGHITAWHRGGGAKRSYRLIDFNNEPSEGIVLATMYDPYRSAFINFNFDFAKKDFYRTVSTDSIYPGTLLTCSPNPEELKLGTRTMLKSIPTGATIHNLSLSEYSRAQYIRAAGTSGQIISVGEKTAKVRLPSERVIEISNRCYATIGEVSNKQHNMEVLGKAGRARYRRRRPITRGIAMNPVDHPHGGRSNGGRPSCSPWGLPTKGGFSMVKKSRKARRLKKQMKIDKMNARRKNEMKTEAFEKVMESEASRTPDAPATV